MFPFLKYRDIGYVIVILALFGMWQYERAARARMLLEMEVATKKLTEKAADLAYKLELEQTDKLNRATDTSIVYVDRIKYVKASDNACASDERMRHGSDGVRAIIQGGNTPTKR